ncbi:hypothetical protein GJ699_09365 [Duganella sp. FT80W]|uniref:Uncharacterized protein n=1 Tax=Duganella guangzhouensis TaxID=2666084 RepID=A0A6I2KWM8_9BURK|nr:hypothetical protein [Duganella guangzhouensis]MRW90191.1 hypothetical protein [Duganella guangzhouensis]
MLPNDLQGVDINNATDLILQSEINKVMLIVEKATSTPVPRSALNDEHSGKWKKVVDFVETHKKKMIWAGIAFCLLLGVMMLLKDYLPRSTLFPMALALGILAEICGVTILLSEVLISIPTFYQLTKAPFGFFFIQLRASTTFDLQMVSDLAQCDPAAVRYVAKHYQYHRMGLEKRGGTLSGSIDKLGLFPALGAVLLLWNQLSISPTGSWAVMLVPMIILFHFMNLYSFSLQQRMDRVIAGLEFSVASTKA